MKTLSYVLIALIFIASCKREDPQYVVGGNNGPSVAGIIAFKVVNGQEAVADSSSTMLIEVQISRNADSVNRFVAFRTTLGTFVNGRATDTVAADANGLATVSLMSGVAGQAKLTAAVLGISIDTMLVFNPALPDDMTVTASKNVADTTDAVVITASLYRNPGTGKISDPAKVFFIISGDTSSSKPLIIVPFSYSVNGVATAVLTDPFSIKGSFTVTCQTASQSQGTISRSVPVVFR